MSSDNNDSSASLPDILPEQAYLVYRIARDGFLGLLLEAVRDDAEVRENLHSMLSEQTPIMRVLHLISAGYSGTPKFYTATMSSDTRLAVWLKYVTFDSDVKVYVLTEQGRRKIARWYDFMGPVKTHPRFAPLWAEVTKV